MVTLPASVLVRIIEGALRAHTPTRIARELDPTLGLDAAVVEAALEAHGAPSRVQLQSSHALLLTLGDEPVSFDLPGRRAASSPGAPADPPAPAAAAAAERRDRPKASPLAKRSLDELLAAAAAHGNQKIATLGARIASQLGDLEQLLDEDQEQEQRRARIAELEAELDQLRGASGRRCDVAACGFVAKTSGGLSIHKARTHREDPAA